MSSINCWRTYNICFILKHHFLKYRLAAILKLKYVICFTSYLSKLRRSRCIIYVFSQTRIYWLLTITKCWKCCLLYWEPKESANTASPLSLLPDCKLWIENGFAYGGVEWWTIDFSWIDVTQLRSRPCNW